MLPYRQNEICSMDMSSGSRCRCRSGVPQGAAPGKRGYRQRAGPTWSSQTQSNLVAPSQTLSFPLSRSPSAHATRSIRGTCVIHGRNFPAFVPIRVHLWLPPSPGLRRTRPRTVPIWSGPVKPSPTQSNLVQPSPTFIFPGKPKIRGIRAIRGSPLPTHPPSPRLRRTGQTWSNLVKPSPTLISSGKAGSGQKKPVKIGQKRVGRLLSRLRQGEAQAAAVLCLAGTARSRGEAGFR